MATVELVTAVMHQGNVLVAGARVTVEDSRAEDWLARGLARTPDDAPAPPASDPVETPPEVPAAPVEASDSPARRKKRGHAAES